MVLLSTAVGCSDSEPPSAEGEIETGCEPGTLDCECYGNQTCNAGLVCDAASHVCLTDGETGVSIGQSYTAVAARDDGSVVLSAVANAKFQLRDEQGTAASEARSGCSPAYPRMARSNG